MVAILTIVVAGHDETIDRHAGSTALSVPRAMVETDIDYATTSRPSQNGDRHGRRH